MTASRQSSRLEAARQFAVESARLAANTRCHNVVVLDVSGISPVTDFLVLATGTSPRQMKTVIDDLEEMAEAQNERQQAMLAKEERFIERFKAQAAKAAQVQSRVKKLDKIEKLDPPKRKNTLRFDFRPAPRSGDDVV